MIEIFVASYSGRSPPIELKAAFGPEGGTLGRGAENRLVLPDPARHVSRLQAEVRQEGGRFRITNVSSANPLFLNDEEIESGGERALAAGDELRVGLYVLGIRSHSPADPAVPQAEFPVGTVTTIRAPGLSAESILGQPPPGATTNGHDPFADLLGAPVVPPATTAAAPRSAAATPLPLGMDLGVATAFSAPLPADVRVFDPSPAALQSTDPFADLLQPAGPAPPRQPDGSGSASARHRQREGPAATIPDDFDPFALPSDASRNTDDPIRDLAGTAIDLESLSRAPPNELLEFPLAAKIDPRDPMQGGTPSLVDSFDGVDPLQLFSSRGSLLHDIGGAPAGAPPMPDQTPQLNVQFSPPRSVPEPSRPAVDDRAPVVAPQPVRETAAQVVPPVAVAPQRETTAAARAPAAAAAAAAAPATRNAPRATPAAPVVAPPGEGARAPRPSSAPAASPADADALLAAFLKGARVSGLTVPSGLTPQLMETIGTLVYHATAGAMELIAARQITKREMRSDVTMIVPKGNNPLKFLPTPEAAIMQMLGPSLPGFITTALAMQQVFDDLRAHELGVIAGMRAAMAEALLQFDPARLDEQLAKSGLLQSLVPSSRRARLWKLFEARYHEVCRNAQDDYQAQFGVAFTKAYEEQVERDRAERGQR